MMTRVEMFDWIRRQLGIIPPVDEEIPGAKAGDTPTSRPKPTNAVLTQCIVNAVRKANRAAGFKNADPTLSVSVAGQTAAGPLRIPLEGLNTLDGRSIQRVLQGWWTSTSGQTTILHNGSEAATTRYRSAWPVEPAGEPRELWVQARHVLLFPAPSSAGTLRLLTETGMLEPLGDLDTFHGIPEYLETALLYMALVEAGKTLVGDVEMEARVEAYMPDAQAGMTALRNWAGSESGRHQPGLAPRSYRTGVRLR